MSQRRRLPLTAVFVVCRTKPGIETLAPAISAFIDPPSTAKRWSIEIACERGDLGLLQRLIAHEGSGTDPHYRSHVFNKALVLAVRHPDDHALQLMECLVAYCPNGFASKGMEEALQLGKVHIAQWLAAHCPNLLFGNDRFIALALSSGNLDTLAWLKEYAGTARRGHFAAAMHEAAAAGDLATVEWVYENIEPELIDDDDKQHAWYRVCEGGHLEVAKYLHEREHEATDQEWISVDAAVASGNLSFVKWLHERFPQCFDSNVTAISGHSGNAELTQWLITNVSTPDDVNHAISEVANSGHLECIKLLYEFCAPSCYKQALVNAATHGHLDVVRWLHISMSETLCDREKEEMIDVATRDAAGNGHLEVAQWLHDHHTTGNRLTYCMSKAAANGQLHVVQWMAAVNEHRRDPSISMHHAAANGHLDVVIWLHENVPSSFLDTGLRGAIDSVAENGHLHVVQWLHANGLDARTTTRAMDSAASNNHLHVVKWLHANRHEGCTKAAMDAVASIEMVEWLHANRTEGCTARAMANAAMKGDFETLLFLHEHYYRNPVPDVSAAFWAYENDEVDILQWLRCKNADIMTDTAILDAASRVSGSRSQYSPQLIFVDGGVELS